MNKAEFYQAFIKWADPTDSYIKEGEDFDDWIYCMSEIDGWPIDAEGEFQDMENYEITQFDETGMTIYCGGDWQEPMKIRIELVENNLKVVNYELDETPSERVMDVEEILAKLR